LVFGHAMMELLRTWIRGWRRCQRLVPDPYVPEDPFRCGEVAVEQVNGKWYCEWDAAWAKHEHI